MKRRLHAWWEGYDLDDAPATAGADEIEPEGSGRDGRSFDDMFEAAKARASEWSDTRKKVTQALWAPGFIVPGGTAYVEELVNGCGLSGAETLLEIGVGMGGATRTVIARFDNYVTGYEADGTLAEEARRQAVTNDIDSKVEIFTGPAAGWKLKKNYFRAALVRDVLYAVENKKALIEKVAGSLKSGESHVIITDLLFQRDDKSEELRRWIAAEPHPVYPWTLDELKQTLEKHKIVPRIAQVESDRYRKMVVDAWKSYLGTLDTASFDPAIGQQIVHEAEFWARRLAAIDAGKLQYVRVVGVRNG